MLKKIEKTGHQTAASKSYIKELRNSMIHWSKYPEKMIEVIFPKKAKVVAYKLRAGEDRKADFIVVQKDQFFVYIDKYCIPALKTVHMYPDLYPKFVADQGALKFVMKGANLMCKGLTNQNASMDEVEQGAIVCVYVQNHEHCLGLGITQMSTEQIKEVNDGIAVQMVHYVGDGFWKILNNK